MFEPYIQFFHNSSVQLTLKFLYYTSFVWVPGILVFILSELWIAYKRAKFFTAQSYLLLEIKVPRDMFKSPRAMELFLNNLYQTGGEATWYDKYWKGQVRPSFSLEIVSIDGGVHFFIWSRKGYRNLLESNLYSQFPGIEVYEVSDYTLPVSYDPATVGLWGTEFKLNKPDSYPIRTYIDYGMDKDPKEEYKVDPITPLIEFLGSLKKGQQAWIQIVLRAHKAEDKDPKTGKMVDLRWEKGAKVEIKKIFDEIKDKEEDGKTIKGRLPTDGEKEIISALERSVSKPGFDVGMRVIFTAPKDIFDANYIGGLIGGLTHFNSNTLNGFKPDRATGARVKYPWQFIKIKGVDFEKQRMLDAYKRRAYFYNEFKRPYFILNTEELATIYHFPGGVAGTPTFVRIASKKAEAPSNLPQ